MIRSIARYMADGMLDRKSILADDYDIYLVGLELLITNVVNTIVILVVGCCLGEWLESIVFLMAFSFTRKYVGGYHTSTPRRCVLMTWGTVLAVFLVMKIINLNDFVYAGVLSISSLVIICFAPVENENKPLKSLEEIRYKKYSRIMLHTQMLFM